ncbi:FkbM family methyltransferase [Hydrotalea sp.]|uniref:FkbM family methyltransferase n=1 Tax=Hydrotalea sp. TaxID=2881279 RepID=UPI002604C5DA|nr:FkbM family methyltransferase [Hydrotalea sp.]
MQIDIKKPQFYLKPKMIWRRLNWKGTTVSTTTSLGIRIDIHPAKVIGRSIGQTGVYDIVLTEVLFRLCKNAQFVLDIGANIGYTAGVAARAMKANGQLWAFEPNPEVLPYLQRNVANLTLKNMQVFTCALSNQVGEAFLQIPTETDNEGLAHITNTFSGNTQKVATETLDHLVAVSEQVDLMKIDVEGHEWAVLQGGSALLQNHRVKHILFEDHAEYPSKVAIFLLASGYTIFRLEKGWLGVQFKDPHSISRVSKWEPVNYIATLDENAVHAAFKKRGYQCLG